MFVSNRPVALPSLSLSRREAPTELALPVEDWRTPTPPLRLTDPAVAVVGLLLAGAVGWLRLM